MKLVTTIASACALATFASAADTKPVAKPTLRVSPSPQSLSQFIKTEVVNPIVNSEASSTEVGQIVAAAIAKRPDDASAIVKAALAVAPDAHRQIVAAYVKKFGPLTHTHRANGLEHGSAKHRELHRKGIAHRNHTHTADEVLDASDLGDGNPLDFPVADSTRPGGSGTGNGGTDGGGTNGSGTGDGGPSGPPAGGPGGNSLLPPGGGGPFTSTPLPVTTF